MQCKYCERDDKTVKKTESCPVSLCPACRKDRQKLLPLFLLSPSDLLEKIHLFQTEIEILRGVYETKKILPGMAPEEAICVLERFLHQCEEFTGFDLEDKEEEAQKVSEALARKFNG